MASLTDVSTPQRDGDRFRLEVAAGWRQGRGAYGGYTIGALIRAVEQSIGDPARTVRSVTAELPAPVDIGPADITVELLRTGKSLTAARAALVQGNEVRGHAVVVLAATRTSASPFAWRDLSPPEVTSWRAMAPLDMQRDRAAWPEFAQHFEYRPVAGLPVPTAGPAISVGWVRPRVPCTVRDAGYIASLVDVWWPSAFTKFPAIRPCATIAFTLHVVSDLADLDPEAPLLYRGTAPVCSDGYFLETRELWGEDGRLVAINQQTFAVI